MNAIFAIAESMLMDRLMSNKPPLTGESKLKFLLLSFSGFTALLTIGFGLYAYYLWLTINYDPTIVMMGMAGATLFLSLLSLSLVFVISKIKKRIILQKRSEIIEIAEDVLNIASKELSEPIKENPLTSALIVSVAGFLAGDRLL